MVICRLFDDGHFDQCECFLFPICHKCDGFCIIVKLYLVTFLYLWIFLAHSLEEFLHFFHESYFSSLVKSLSGFLTG